MWFIIWLSLEVNAKLYLYCYYCNEFIIFNKKKFNFIEFLTEVCFKLFKFSHNYEESSAVHRKSGVWCMYQTRGDNGPSNLPNQNFFRVYILFSLWFTHSTLHVSGIYQGYQEVIEKGQSQMVLLKDYDFLISHQIYG